MPTVTIAEFLLARIAEDEEAATAATGKTWRVDDETYPMAIQVADSHRDVVSGGRWGGEGNVFEDGADAHHIARHDPARVLAECEAKRRIVERHLANRLASDEVEFETELVLRALASVYADHPDFREEWRLA